MTITKNDISGILSALKNLEPLMYSANEGQPRAYFEQLLAPDFWEVGASGKIYDREFVLNTLEQRQQHPIAELWQAFDFAVHPIENQHYLLTYSLQQPTRLSRCTTLWRRTESGWQMVYHQGTVVS